MKIVIIRLNVGDFGKIGTYNVQEIGLANALIRKGHQVVVLYLNRKVKSVVVDEKYEFVHYLPHISIGLHGIFNTTVLKQFNPEKMILFSDNQLWSKNVIMWCKKRNIKCVNYFGGVLSDNPKRINQFYTKLILMRNKNLYNYSINIAKTKKVKVEMEALKIPLRKVVNIGLDDSILRNAYNPDNNIRKTLGFNDDELVLLFVGRLVNYKNPLLACKILLELLNRGIKSRLVIIGIGSLKSELQKYIEEKNIKSNVTWIERVLYEDMYKYMVSCDCYINLSTKEIFGMAILEAMYYGLPVVAHEAPGPNEIIENGISGYLCNYVKVSEWVDQVIIAVKNKNELASASKLRIYEKFMWDNLADEFINLY
jgi:1,2-diacylglycerol 3-alpha-glucosyltransferase